MSSTADDPSGHLLWKDTAPDHDTFIDMRAACGWGRLSPAMAQAALDGSLFNVTVLDGPDIVGLGRVVGDGALYFYLQDIIVAPAWRGRGLGHKIVDHLLGQIRAAAPNGSTVGLMAAEGMEHFYAKHGFTHRPDTGLGAGMTLVL